MKQQSTTQIGNQREHLFLWVMMQMGFPHNYLTQYQFCPDRKFKTDIAYTLTGGQPKGILIEIDGGTWQKQGGHGYGKRAIADREKDRIAQIMGFNVFRFEEIKVSRTGRITIPEDVKKGLEQVKQLLFQRRMENRETNHEAGTFHLTRRSHCVHCGQPTPKDETVRMQDKILTGEKRLAHEPADKMTGLLAENARLLKEIEELKNKV